MKKVLLLVAAVLMVANVAMADHLGIYNDAVGSSCTVVPGFNATAACYLVHKFTTGSAGSRFKCVVSVGTGSLFSLNTSFSTTGTIGSDMSVGYGGCNTGTILVGSLGGFLNPGDVLEVKAADAQPSILVSDCLFLDHAATGGKAYAGTTGNCNEVATAQSTWGQVKALYR